MTKAKLSSKADKVLGEPLVKTLTKAEAIQAAVPTKSVVKSLTLWGILVAIVPELASGLNELAGTGVLGVQAAAIVHLVGAGIAVFGRMFSAATHVTLTGAEKDVV